MSELLHKGARGDVSLVPLARLIGDAFQRELTGCLSVEHGGGLSRVHLQAGQLVGTQVFVGFKPLGQVLLELGWIDVDGLDRSLMEVARGRRQGEALISMGLIDGDQLSRALDLQQRRNLGLLLALKEGKWEWSQEPPPAWTQDLIVDPIRALVDELEAGVGPLDPVTVLEGELSGHNIRLSDRGLEWLNPLVLEEEDILAVQQLKDSKPFQVWVRESGLSPERARAVAAALVLAGIVRGERPEEETQAPVNPEDREVVGADELEAIEIISTEFAQAAETTMAAQPAPSQQVESVEPLPAHAIIVEEQTKSAEALLSEPAPKAPEPAPSAGVSAEVGHNVRSRLLARAFHNIGFRPHAPEPPPPPPVAEPPPPAPVARGQRLLPEERLLIQQIEEVHGRINHEDHFQRLHISRDATADQVKKAFFERAARYHPDRAVGALAPLQNKMKEIFSSLSEAYEVLSDSHKRADYVRSLAIAHEAAETGVDPQKREEAKVFFQKGQIQLRRRDYHAAEELFRKAAELDPKKGNYPAMEAWCILVDPLRPKGEREKVRLLLKVALEDKHSDQAHYVAGVLARLENHLVDAETYFARAVELNEKNIEAIRELKFVRVKLEKEAQGSGSLMDRLRGR